MALVPCHFHSVYSSPLSSFVAKNATLSPLPEQLTRIPRHATLHSPKRRKRNLRENLIKMNQQDPSFTFDGKKIRDWIIAIAESRLEPLARVSDTVMDRIERWLHTWRYKPPAFTAFINYPVPCCFQSPANPITFHGQLRDLIFAGDD